MAIFRGWLSRTGSEPRGIHTIAEPLQCSPTQAFAWHHRAPRASELLDHREGLHAVCKEVRTTVTVLCIAMRPSCRDGSKSGITNASSRLS